MKVQRIVVLAVLSLALGALDLAAQRVNVKYMDRSGNLREDSGTVDAWSYSELKLKVGRGERVLTSNDIVDVSFLNPPDGFEAAANAHRKGEFNNAIGLCREALDGRIKKSEEWAKEFYAFWTWDSLWHLGDRAEAKKVQTTFLAEYPKSQFIPDIEIAEAELDYALGTFVEAEGNFSTFRRQGVTRGYARRYLLRAGAGQVQCLIDTQRLDPAKAVIDEMRSLAQSDDDRTRLTLMDADILVARQSFKQAKEIFDRVLASASLEKAPFAVAKASNGLGECHYGLKESMAAIEAFSRTFALFDEDPARDADVGWAFWRFSNACKQYAAAAESDDDRRFWEARGRTNRQRAAELYRWTRGGQEARREMGLGK
ncbi:MAG: hypothetical protein KDB53_14930 [Planctomycetes bacterium]|nr:hypothetical protein [Planctomycetota bacterium]